MPCFRSSRARVQPFSVLLVVAASTLFPSLPGAALAQDEIVELDDERRAAMVSNLMVVLCGEKDAHPVINAGSLY